MFSYIHSCSNYLTSIPIPFFRLYSLLVQRYFHYNEIPVSYDILNKLVYVYLLISVNEIILLESYFAVSMGLHDVIYLLRID